jgi:hypothetical protein
MDVVKLARRPLIPNNPFLDETPDTIWKQSNGRPGRVFPPLDGKEKIKRLTDFPDFGNRQSGKPVADSPKHSNHPLA